MKSISTIALALLLVVHAAWSQQSRTKTNLEDEEEDYATVTTYGVTTNTNSGLLGGFVFRHSTRLDSRHRPAR